MFPPPREEIPQIAHDILHGRDVQKNYDFTLQEPSPNRYAHHCTWNDIFSAPEQSQEDHPLLKPIQPIMEEWVNRSLVCPPQDVYVPILCGTEKRCFLTSDVTGLLCGAIQIQKDKSNARDRAETMIRNSSKTRIAVASNGRAVPYAQLLGLLTIPDDYEILSISPDIIEANPDTRRAWSSIADNFEVIYDERKHNPRIFTFEHLDTHSPIIRRADGQPIPDEIVAEKMTESMSSEMYNVEHILAMALQDRTISPDDITRNLMRELCLTPYDSDEMRTYVYDMLSIPVIYSKDRTAAYAACRAVSVDMLPVPSKHFIRRAQLLSAIWESMATQGRISSEQARAILTSSNTRNIIASVYEENGIDLMLESLSIGVPIEDVLA